MRKGKKKLAQMMAAVLTATTLLQTPVSVFADPVVKEQVEKEGVPPPRRFGYTLS